MVPPPALDAIESLKQVVAAQISDRQKHEQPKFNWFGGTGFDYVPNIISDISALKYTDVSNCFFAEYSDLETILLKHVEAERLDASGGFKSVSDRDREVIQSVINDLRDVCKNNKNLGDAKGDLLLCCRSLGSVLRNNR